MSIAKEWWEWTVAIRSKANLLKEESHLLHIPLGGRSKERRANGLALILFTTTDDNTLLKTVAEKTYSIRKSIKEPEGKS